MSEKLTGLRFSAELSSEICSAAMKSLLVRLFASGKITYSQFLYPYADSLLLSDENCGVSCFFGTHALLCGVEGELLNSCIDDDVRPEIIELDYSAADITRFFDISDRLSDADMLIGGFEEMLQDSIHPWFIRDRARRFCSFAETIARMKQCAVCGTVGGYVAVKTENKTCDDFIELYASKTGRIMKVWNK